MKTANRKQRICKKALALLLAVVLLTSAFSVTVSATGEWLRSSLRASAYTLKTDCGGKDDTPTILIPGISQSRVWLLDENGEYKLNENGKRINCFPGVFDIQPPCCKSWQDLWR